jgi:Protein prenyltransferase alpha subunit repeat
MYVPMESVQLASTSLGAYVLLVQQGPEIVECYFLRFFLADFSAQSVYTLFFVRNARKLAVERGHSTLRAEVQFLDLLFCKHSKSSHSWAHRRWCWSRALTAAQRLNVPTATPDSSAECELSLSSELAACSRVAELYPKNYYAWSQRAWVLRRCAHTTVGDSSSTSSDTEASTTATGGTATSSAAVDDASTATVTAKAGSAATGAVHSSATTATASDATAGAGTAAAADGSKKVSTLTAELTFTQQWLSSHVSDHSALQHRAVVVRLAAAAATNTSAAVQLLRRELQHSKQLLLQHPGHESLWCYCRFAFQAAVLLLAPSVSYNELTEDFDHSWDRWATVTASAIACSCTGYDSGDSDDSALDEDCSIDSSSSDNSGNEQQSSAAAFTELVRAEVEFAVR